MAKPTKKRDPLIAAVLAWIIPGAGHFYLGKRGKAILFFVLLTGSFAFGAFLGEFKNVYPERYTASFAAQIFAGTPAVAAMLLNYSLDGQIDEGEPNFDMSFVYCCVAGLLNLLLIIDAAYTASGGRHTDESA